MVPPASAWIPRVPAYSGTAPSGGFAFRVRGLHPLRPAFPDRSATLSSSAGFPGAALQPRQRLRRRFGLLPVRSPLLGESRLDFFSCRYLDGSLPCVFPMHPILFTCMCLPFEASGLPHSDTPGSWDICSSPGLFAACHVLPRLAAPRHPPWTLFSLDHIVFLVSLPLSMLKTFLRLEAGGLEPPTPGLQSRCSSQLSYAPGLAPSSAHGKRESRGRLLSLAGLPTCRPTALFISPEAVRPPGSNLSLSERR